MHRRLLLVITVFLSLALLCAFSIAGWSFYQGHTETCRARSQILAAVRDIFVAAQVQTDADPHITADQRDRSDRFFKAALARLDKARCH